MPHDVFISYSTKDKPLADAVCARLEGRGIRCWIAPRDIIPGADWGGSIVEAISEARVFVLIFTSNYNASQQTGHEVERAVNKGLHIIPLRVENVPMTPSLEYFMGKRHWLDAITPPVESHLDKLGDAIERVLGITPAKPSGPRDARAAPSPATPATSSAAAPAPGLGPPARADADADDKPDPGKKKLLLIGAAVALVALVAVIAISASGGKAPSEAARAGPPTEVPRKPEAPRVDLGPDLRIGAPVGDSLARSRALVGNRSLPGDAAEKLKALDFRWREVQRLAWTADNIEHIRQETDSIKQAAAALEASLPGAVEAYERAALSRRVAALRALLDEGARPFDVADDTHAASLQSLRERLAELQRRDVLLDRLEDIEAEAARIEAAVHAWVNDARSRLDGEKAAVERAISLASGAASETRRILAAREGARPIEIQLDNLEQRIAQSGSRAETVSALRRAAEHAESLAEEARGLRAEAAALPVAAVNELLEEAKTWIGRTLHLLSHREHASDPGLRIVERAEARPIRAEESGLVLSLSHLGRDSAREVRWRIRDGSLAGPVSFEREATLRRVVGDLPGGIAWAGLDRIEGSLFFASDDASALAFILPAEVSLLAPKAGRHHSEWRTIGGALPFDALWFSSADRLTLDVAALCADGPRRLRGSICLPDDVPVGDGARCQVRVQADGAQVWAGELSARDRRAEIDAVVRRGSRSLSLGLGINPGVDWNFAALGLRFEPAPAEADPPATAPRPAGPAQEVDAWAARVDSWAGRTLVSLQIRDGPRSSTGTHLQFSERQGNSVSFTIPGPRSQRELTGEINPDGLSIPLPSARGSTQLTSVLYKPVPNPGHLSLWPHGEARIYEGRAPDGTYFIIEPPRGAVPASALIQSTASSAYNAVDGGKTPADPISLAAGRDVTIPVRLLTAERSYRLRGAAHVTAAGVRPGRARLVVLVDGQERQSYALDGVERIDVNAPIARNAGVVVIRQEGFGPGVVLNCIWLTPN